LHYWLLPCAIGFYEAIMRTGYLLVIGLGLVGFGCAEGKNTGQSPVLLATDGATGQPFAGSTAGTGGQAGADSAAAGTMAPAGQAGATTGGSGGAVLDSGTGSGGAAAGAGGTGGIAATDGAAATAGTGGTAGSGGASGTSATVCSGTFTGTPGSTSDLTLNGRNYTLHIGSSVKPSEASPLVFSLHGLTMTPASMEWMAGWDPVADREGIIIARPAGVGNMNAWDVTGNTDFDLMKAIIEDVNAKACVDRKRIYATGFSMGGFMSYSMACRMGDIIAAVGPCSGGGSAGAGCTARPVPVYAWHGDADSTVAYSSGQSAVQSWVSHNGCTGSPVSFNVGTANCQSWDSCNEDGDVKFCTVPGGGHTYTKAATEELWQFFKEHPLP
jgi:polyhydroxybutyrate depolymerase